MALLEFMIAIMNAESEKSGVNKANQHIMSIIANRPKKHEQ